MWPRGVANGWTMYRGPLGPGAPQPKCYYWFLCPHCSLSMDSQGSCYCLGIFFYIYGAGLWYLRTLHIISETNSPLPPSPPPPLLKFCDLFQGWGVVVFISMVYKCGETLPVSVIAQDATRKEVFYLPTHSTHFIYGYMASGIW